MPKTNGIKMSAMKRMLRNHLIICFVVLALSASPGICLSVWADTDPFPLYPSIEPNVSFWKEIYSRYSTSQGVIHDKVNLNIIYGVIELDDPDLPGSRKINRERTKKDKKKYRIILKKLAQGASPSGPEEQRVADLFGPDAKHSDFKKAARNIRCQVGQKDRFRKGVIRSGAYLEEIRRIFDNYGLPEDLAYLPHVESSFNPKAYSKFGAAGIWQFTRSTGRQYMKIGYTVDERRDPILSSRAAARLMKKNYDKFLNWPMAITAYNHGTNGMLRARRAKKTYEEIFKAHKSRLFKFASRNFYSEFLAAREVAENYRQYFGELTLDVPSESTEVVLAGYASLPRLARLLEVDLEILRPLNPALRNPVFSGQKRVPTGYRLRLPTDPGRNWKSLIAELSPEIYRHYQKRSRIYTVRKGDTALEIARVHGVRLQDMIAVNNLDARATIYANQTLRIPLPGEKVLTPVTPELAALDGKEKQDLEAARLLANIEASSSSKRMPSKETITRNFTPSSAAQTLNAAKNKPVAKSRPAQPKDQPLASKPSPALAAHKPVAFERPPVAESSQLTAAGKKPADRLSPEADSWTDNWIARYRQPETTFNPSIVIGNLVVERVEYQNDKPVGVIRVEVEETLGHYAEWLKVTAREIRRLNGYRYGRMIHLDQQLIIPLHRVTKEEFEENRFEYHKELAEDFFAAYRVEGVQIYSVKRGDNIWTLSRKEFEVPMWLIRRFNARVDFNTLMPSQKLLIPVTGKII